MKGCASTDDSSFQTFTLLQLHNFLLISLEVLDTDDKLLFKEICNSEALSYFLKQTLIELQQTTPLDALEYDKLKQKILALLKEINVYANSNYVLGQCMKTFFQKGEILNEFDLRVAVCRVLFIEEIKVLLPDAKENKENIQLCFKQFMGQLVQLGYWNVVQVIHLFLHICKKMANAKQGEEGHGDSVEYIAKYISPCLTGGLRLDGYLYTQGMDDSSPRSRECAMGIRLTHAILELDIFNLTLRDVRYEQWHQDDIRFHELLALLMSETYSSTSPIYIESNYEPEKEKHGLSGLFRKLSFNGLSPRHGDHKSSSHQAEHKKEKQDKEKKKEVKEKKKEIKKKKKREEKKIAKKRPIHKKSVQTASKSTQDKSEHGELFNLDNSQNLYLQQYNRMNALAKMGHSEVTLPVTKKYEPQKAAGGSVILFTRESDEPLPPRNLKNS